MALIQDEGTSITASIPGRILIAGALAGMTAFTAAIRHTFREECIPGPSADSIMAVMRELTPSEDSPALVAFTGEAAEVFMAEVVEASTVVAAATAAVATDSSSHEVIKHETRNDKNDKQD
jgi:hypothetical protein